MANFPNFLSLSLTLIVLFNACCCLAQLDLSQQEFWQSERNQQHRLRKKTSCRIRQLSAQKPKFRYQSEAGVTEYWDANSEDFECAGMEFVRYVIQPKGLFIPSYANSHQLVYVVQGSGILGTVFPGCAETYESESYSEPWKGQGQQSYFYDRHQKLRRFRTGDILAWPQGITHWTYNDGQTPLILVSFLDVANDANQLDLKYREFFLAGKPQAVQPQGGEEENNKRNVLAGFEDKLLALTFNVEIELIRKLRANGGGKGTIVTANNLRMVLPQFEEEHERPRDNGLEETLCTAKLRQNIDHPARSDAYNPRGGRISSLNGQDLPILNILRLSAERGILYKDALVGPQYSTNSHSAYYVTRGSARIQVVGNQGNTVFDGVVRVGQLLIVPQNFVSLKKATNEGFEYVAFKTNENAMNTQLAGRLSVMRAMPEEVLMNSYGISREEAKGLKYSREEAGVFSPGANSRIE